MRWPWSREARADDAPDWRALSPQDVELEAHVRNGTVSFADLCLEAKRANTVPDRRELYARMLACFEKANGPITFRYDTKQLNMAQTERPRARFLRWFGFSPYASLHVHYEATLAPADFSLVEEIDDLCARAEVNLRSSDRKTTIDELASELSGVLTGLHSAAALPDWLRDQIAQRVSYIERQYRSREARGINLTYFLAMVMGLLPAALVAVVAGWLLDQADIEDYSFATFLATFVSGALGAVVSVMVRMSHNRFQQAPEVGKGWIRLLAAVRPFLGGVFGTLSYFALESHLMALTINEEEGSRFFAFCVVAFLAGFSERVAQDMLVATARGAGATGVGESPPRIGGRPPHEQLELDSETQRER